MIDDFRNRLRQFPAWVRFQELNREGWIQAAIRRKNQQAILKTPPLFTDPPGRKEIRVLTWRRDWINVIWALKTFYFYSEDRLPLIIHDGGLEEWQVQKLKEHFPSATLILKKEADDLIEDYFRKNHLLNCLAYRKQNIACLKVFDFFLLSKAERVLSIDSDILFFKKPTELLTALDDSNRNIYNKDMQYAYSMSQDELQEAFGIRPPPLINSGLSVVSRASMNFEKINEWLAHPKLFADKWVTEQTLHALCATLYGVNLLPSIYRVDTAPGLSEELVCKHYPGFFRPLLYQEGMRHLIEKEFIQNATFAFTHRERSLNG